MTVLAVLALVCATTAAAAAALHVAGATLSDAPAPERSDGGTSAVRTSELPPLPEDELPLSVSVVGSTLVDALGRPVRLLGANRSGTQYACVEDWGVFDGPVDDAAIEAMASWGMTAVRLSLNEHCWLGINGVSPTYGGAAYRDAVIELVDRIVARRMYVILDLHWSAPGGQRATEQQAMADRDHAPAFWRSVAAAFRLDRAVVFDLYNEPHPDDNRDTPAAWRCVRDGGRCPGVDFPAAGSQELLDAVRGTGATNVVLVGGPQYAGTLTRWLDHAPVDPVRQLAASIHVYGPEFSPCDSRSCWDGVIAPLAEQVPVVMGEIGIHGTSCSSAFVEPLMEWADAHGVSYLAWGWVVSDCTDEPALITSYDGTPTAYGAGVRDHLRQLEAQREAAARRCALVRPPAT